jgi:AcrR family transcriptional regulator
MVRRKRGDGREQLLETALRLFGRDGVEATSLQDIADEMGVTKAGVYYHFKTKDEIVLGVVEPVFARLDAILTRAEAHRARSARIEEFVIGLVDLVLDSRIRFSALMGDPYVAKLIEQHPNLITWWHRIRMIVAGPDPDPATMVPLLIFLTGLGGPLNDPQLAALDNAVLREHFLDSGRRLLQLRKRATAATPPDT